MRLDPTIRTPLTRDFYETYLQTPIWRRRRHIALTRANWRCERCASRRDLQVHHKTYERLGGEQDRDLEVVCLNCHEAEHIDQMATSSNGVYLKLASEALREQPLASIADLSEAVKRRCVALRIRYEGEDIHRALQLLSGTRLRRVESRKQLDGAPLPADAVSRAEAHELLMRLGLSSTVPRLVKPMPAIEKTPLEQAEHEARLRQQVQAERAQASRHRPLRERLEDIFAWRA